LAAALPRSLCLASLGRVADLAVAHAAFEAASADDWQSRSRDGATSGPASQSTPTRLRAYIGGLDTPIPREITFPDF